MARAFLAYYSDCVLSASGVAVSGATVALYAASSFAAGVLPTGGTGLPAATASTTTDINGKFALAVPPDDYHQLVTSTPYGGGTVYAWSYFVPVCSAEMVRRGVAGARAAGLPRALARLAAGANVTIFCCGDDVTVGYNATGTVTGGWVGLLAARWPRSIPRPRWCGRTRSSYGTTSDGAIPGLEPDHGADGDGDADAHRGQRGGEGRHGAAHAAPLRQPDHELAGGGRGGRGLRAVGVDDRGDAAVRRRAADFQAQLEALVNITRSFTQAEVLLCTPHCQRRTRATWTTTRTRCARWRRGCARTWRTSGSCGWTATSPAGPTAATTPG